MQQLIKRYFWVALLAAGVELSSAFSLMGPIDSTDPGTEPWQVVTIGYDMGNEETTDLPGSPEWLMDIGGPHNIGEEYRRNIPVLYYSYDPSFNEGDYFGLQGQQAIDDAFTVMNGFTNVDKFSPSLSEFPLTGEHYNYTAEALYLTDLKSTTLHLLVEQMGLTDPARFSWTLHDRYPGDSCPVTTTYLVVQRNFDGISAPSQQSLVYSPYVNEALLSYYISEHCSGPPPALAITVPYMTDPAGLNNIPVAANTFQEFQEFDTFQEWHLPTIYGLQIGGYYNGLTRDDVAGLRYLMTTNNANVEQLGTNVYLFAVSTNPPGQEALFPSSTATNGVSSTNGGFYVYDGTYGYGDYGYLVASSVTNSPAVLQALYPGLLIASSTNYFVLATNWTYTQYFTNTGYGSTYPPPLVLVTVSNAHPYLLEKFVTTFANVVPDKVRPTTSAKLQTTIVGPNIGAPYGSAPVTNVTYKNVTLNTPSGDFFVLPLFGTNLCPLDLLRPGLTNVFAYTNSLASANTNFVNTNAVTTTTTNISVYSSTLAQVTYFTNYTWVVDPVTCTVETNAVEKFRGIGGIRFIRNDTYDYLTGQYVPPITNYYTMTSYDFTNHVWVSQKIVRIVVQPDVVLASSDLADGPAGINFVRTVDRTIGYNSSQIISGLHGPGTIGPPAVITYDRVGSIFENGPFTDKNSYINPTEVNETTQIPLLQWASYDGSTNPPVVYPNGTSLENLENQMSVQLVTTPSGPLVGTAGLNYSAQFAAVGGPFTPQFTWTASGVPGEAGSGLPPGLSLSTSGLLSGTPAASGTYDFVLQLTDIQNRTVQWTLSITIN